MKKLVCLLAIISVCFAMSLTVLASESPSATSEDSPPTTNNASSSPSMSSPTTADTLVIPGLIVAAGIGTSIAVVAKKKPAK